MQISGLFVSLLGTSVAYHWEIYVRRFYGFGKEWHGDGGCVSGHEIDYKWHPVSVKENCHTFGNEEFDAILFAWRDYNTWRVPAKSFGECSIFFWSGLNCEDDTGAGEFEKANIGAQSQKEIVCAAGFTDPFGNATTARSMSLECYKDD